MKVAWHRRSLIRTLSVMALSMSLLIWMSAAVLPAGAQGASDWSQYLNGPAHSSYNAAATSITVAAVQAGDLQPVWRWVPPASTNGANTALMASPTVVDGVVYIGDEDGEFYAIDEASRSVLWSRFLGYDTPKPSGPCSGIYTLGVTSTAAVLPDPVSGNLTVYVNSADGNLYALDAQTGNIDWKSVVDVPSTTVNDYYAWGSPLVVNGTVYVGTASECDHPLIPASVQAFDQENGDLVGALERAAEGQVGREHLEQPSGVGGWVSGRYHREQQRVDLSAAAL